MKHLICLSWSKGLDTWKSYRTLYSAFFCYQSIGFPLVDSSFSKHWKLHLSPVGSLQLDAAKVSVITSKAALRQHWMCQCLCVTTSWCTVHNLKLFYIYQTWKCNSLPMTDQREAEIHMSYLLRIWYWGLEKWLTA